jgi:hypothetical protein
LSIIKSKSSQSVHLHDLTINIRILLCDMAWESKSNTEYPCETGKTRIFEQHVRILVRNYDTKKTQIRKKTAFHMKILLLIYNWDWPGPTNRRNNTLSRRNHDISRSPFRDGRNITDRMVCPKQNSHK